MILACIMKKLCSQVWLRHWCGFWGGHRGTRDDIGLPDGGAMEGGNIGLGIGAAEGGAMEGDGASGCAAEEAGSPIHQDGRGTSSAYLHMD